MSFRFRTIGIAALAAGTIGAACAGYTIAAGADAAPAEIRLLGEPVNGRLVRDALGNPIGFETFSEEPFPGGFAVAELNTG